MKILFVGGNFDNNEGRKSSLVEKFASQLVHFEDIKLTLINGGNFKDIEAILQSVVDFDCVFWWPNIPNNFPKIRNVKDVNSRVMLVTSKRNDNSKYSIEELIARSLGAKANLCVQFSKENDKFNFLVFDPLGTAWYKGDSLNKCVVAIFNRITFLKSMTRVSTKQASGSGLEVPENEMFFEHVRRVVDIFHLLVPHEEKITRFLGNSSFRCTKGFPSFKHGKFVFVSRRNIDKRFISKENFVQTYLDENGNVFYYGESKPSVDTPVQLNLYKKFPKINFMVHSHCYIKNGVFTNVSIPCGAVEEVAEIINAVKDTEKEYYAINLIGHGSLVMSSDVEKLHDVEYFARQTPEEV